MGALGIRRIVTGGQTGADRAALDVALALGFEVGGWVPRDRRAEDGEIPRHYPNLVESGCRAPAVRTWLNVRDSDATLIVSRGALSGGSAYTRESAQRQGKPHLHLDLAALTCRFAAGRLRRWLEQTRPSTLHVAGPRRSEDPEIGEAVGRLLRAVLEPGAPTAARVGRSP